MAAARTAAPTVPFLDLRAIVGEDAEVAEAVARVVRSGRYVGGPEVEAFERAWAGFCGTRHAVGAGNGLDALTLALLALDVGPGDEVIVPSWTFIATWLAVSRVGAKPVPVEVDPDTGNLDPDRVAAALSPRTRALVAVHLYGQPADTDRISDALAGSEVALIEDAAQAHGAMLRGRRTGALGRIAAFSFYPGKNLGALGDGGAVTTDDEELARRVRRLGNYGSERKYEHLERGANSRLDPIQAAALSVRLRRLEADNARRRAIADTYMDTLGGLEWLRLPRVIDGAEPVWHLFVVRTERRDALARHLAERGIETGLHYPVANHRSGAYADQGFDLPIADELAATCLSLPIGPHLSDADVERVIEAVTSFPA